MELEPILMLPSYRCGRETPWGGDRLHKLYGKYAPGERVGESFEISTLTGHESCAPEGQTLTELIRLYGKDLLGEKVKGDFPLLIKLVDAKERQSVHVHSNEPGEGWIILRSEDSSVVTCGLREAEDAEVLVQKLKCGEEVDGLLQNIPVKEGDAVYVPAGTVHSLGDGVLVYSIQHSNCQTYRLYDWNRSDSRDCKRRLHLEKAPECMSVETATIGEICEVPSDNCLCERLLDTALFSVYRLTDCDEKTFVREKDHFSVITCLTDVQLRLESGKMMYLAAGQTVLIPACTCTFTLSGKAVLLAVPQV